MKSFVALAAVLAVASAGLLPVRRPTHHQQRHYAPQPSLQILPQQHDVYEYTQQQPSHANSDHLVYVVNETPSNNIGLGDYAYGYALSDGTHREESAELVHGHHHEDDVLRVRGSYSWLDAKTGQTYTVSYTADENGFHPQGDHLPVAPVA